MIVSKTAYFSFLFKKTGVPKKKKEKKKRCAYAYTAEVQEDGAMSVASRP